MAYENGVYSLLNVTGSITGPNIALPITGTAEEGYDIEQEADVDTLTVGAGGDTMHSIRAGQNGTFMLRLLKTSTLNRGLINAYNFQRASAANAGRNTIVIDDPVRGDTITCLSAGFKRVPTIKYAEQGGTQDWAFVCGRIEYSLGDGTTAAQN